jgi:replicative DNA helicase
MVLVQLNRDSKGRQDKRPQLSDIRESGAIEQDADFVFFAYREYLFSRDDRHKNDLEIGIAKNRHGVSNVTCYLKFNPSTQEIWSPPWNS